MYDNTYVANLTLAEAVKVLADSNATIGNIKNNIIFGNGSFTQDTKPHEGNVTINGLLATPVTTSMMKQICIVVTDITNPEVIFNEYIKANNNYSLFTDVKLAVEEYIRKSSALQSYFVPANAENVVNQYMPILLDKYIILTIWSNNALENKNSYIVIDFNGRSLIDIQNEWKAALKNSTTCVIGDTRMEFYKLIQKAEYISGGNDQLIVLNKNASVQYSVTVAEDDGDGVWSDNYYAVLSINGEKYYCQNELDLLTHISRQMHVINS